jgi:hypothetical protein
MYDIPGFPPPVPQSEKVITDPKGAKMVEAYFLPVFFQEQLKTHFQDKPRQEIKESINEGGTTWLD